MTDPIEWCKETFRLGTMGREERGGSNTVRKDFGEKLYTFTFQNLVCSTHIGYLFWRKSPSTMRGILGWMLSVHLLLMAEKEDKNLDL